MFSWLALAVLTFFSIVFGLSQQVIGQTPWAYLLIILWAALAALLWLSSQVGQKLAHEQMIELKQHVQHALRP